VRENQLIRHALENTEEQETHAQHFLKVFKFYDRFYLAEVALD